MNFIRENILKIVIMIVVIIVLTIVFSSCNMTKTVNVGSKYEESERKLKETAINFTTKHTSFLPKDENETTKLNMRTLIKNDAMKQIYAIDDSNVACSGYVLITKKGATKYNFIPFIKCGKYYETKTLGDYIKENDEVVTENDGLYKYDEEYVYRGENPKNYLVIGEQTFRIISIKPTGELRVISTKDYDSNVWDDRYNSKKGKSYGINIFDKSRIKERLNEIYETDTEFLTDQLRSIIVPYDICVGPVVPNNSDFSGTQECSLVSSNQYLGMIQLNEYFRASIDAGCTSINKPDCSNYNYFSSINAYSIISQNPTSANSYQVTGVSGGTVKYMNASSRFKLYLTFFLDTNTLYKSGDGSKNNPYVIR